MKAVDVVLILAVSATFANGKKRYFSFMLAT